MDDLQNKFQQMLILIVVIAIIVNVYMIVVWWKIFEGRTAGLAILIPIYSAMVMCRVAGKSDFYWLLFLIPIVNVFAMFSFLNGYARAFGKGGIFMFFGLFLFGIIGFSILAFSANTLVLPEFARAGVAMRETMTTGTMRNTGAKTEFLSSYPGEKGDQPCAILQRPSPQSTIAFMEYPFNGSRDRFICPCLGVGNRLDVEDF